MSPSVVSTFGIGLAIGGVGGAAVWVAAAMPGACARARREVAAKAPRVRRRRVGRVSIGRSNYGPTLRNDRAPRSSRGSLLRWRPGRRQLGSIRQWVLLGRVPPGGRPARRGLGAGGGLVRRRGPRRRRPRRVGPRV